MSTVKSFDVENPVLTSLRGLVHANPQLTLIESDKVVIRKSSKDKVSVLSGGGAGHEPTHAGFIGKGCLTGAISGEIFASPSTKQIINGVKVVHDNGSKGVLLIVKNYTGDVLHFGLASERAKSTGIDTEVVVIGDDVAVGRSKGGLVGRRAIAGTLFVHKTVGAFAEYYPSHTLKSCAELARVINDNLVTIGASLDHAKVPGHPFESELKSDQMELGMGIHNEPGVKILSPIPSAEELIKLQILPKLLDQSDKDRAFVEFDSSDEVALLVNNLGGVSNLILSAITEITTKLLKSEYGITPIRTYQGTMMTALNGEGFSITLLNISRASKSFTEVPIIDLLDAETDAPGWPVKKFVDDAPKYNKSLLEVHSTGVKPVGTYDAKHFQKWFQAGADALIKAEPYITKLDTQVGDGDCGTTLVSGGEGITKNFDSIPTETLSQALDKISDLVETYMGGTSGGLYSIFISGLSQGLISQGADQDTPVDSKLFGQALETALDTLYKYTRARVGDSTVIDALEPFVKEFSKSHDLKQAIDAADKGAKSTGTFEAKFGRASYVGESSNVPDPGAIGLVEFLKGVSTEF
ncbi:DAK2 [Cyberlindnera jadinii]|uniref:DAK2 protein n=1 Tax=Cyberlindnera jadinii (strain ATCC 18201 / CBS 1600 / BCRC 20928 / JCM 3617 / NBRC 0987 / NRRL Y-1542) TaxID=983966 RepID=A0A0H5C007_CYBJN|nr:DAK2 [Cyberlindnera jadinii]